MASSRQMRRSGLSNANQLSIERERVIRKDDIPSTYDGSSLDSWEEPPPREPVPSFRDYKGLEPHGVLEHMAPLGHGPTPKARARVRLHEPPRRAPQLKNGDVKVVKENGPMTESNLPPVTHSPGPRHDPPSPPTPSDVHHHLGGQDGNARLELENTPTLSSPTRPGPLDTPPVSALSLLPNQPITPWEDIVQAAVRRSNELGNMALGVAIRHLYKQALTSQDMANLLNAVLSQNQTPDQIASFQIYIKAAKKQVKRGEAGGKTSTPSVANSPAKNLRNSGTRQAEASKSSRESMEHGDQPSNAVSHTPSKRSTMAFMTNGSPAKSDRPTKRAKRSFSVSDNESPLSDLNSDIEDHIEAYAPDKVESTISNSLFNPTTSQASKDRPGTGPRMGSFSNKLPIELETPEARIAARKRLARGFDNYLVQESSIRSSLPLLREPSPPETALQQRAQHPRRSAVAYRTRRNDDESSESSLSSYNESLLPPPDLGVRGITPQLAPDTQADQLPDQWFCWRCTMFAADEYEDDERRGIWTGLRKSITYRNPTAFHLPRDVRDYFEGVITGEEGEYDDLHNIRISKARTGYEEIPDNLKLKDKKDHTVLCFQCGGSSTGKREIVPCDYCSLCWHLDCLDPPLASAPNKKSTNGRPRQTWMCPNHADHELMHMAASATTAGRQTIRKAVPAYPEENIRTFRTRKPKTARLVGTGLRRGFTNNGLIEIEEEQSEEESEIEREMSGVVYKVPERGIKLDFIDRIKKANLEAMAYKQKFAPRPKNRQKSPHIHTTNLNPPTAEKQQKELDKRPFRERKAALNLMQLAWKDAELDADQLLNLIGTLTAEAPANVERLLNEDDQKMKKDRGRTAADLPVSDQEKKDLETLIALARRRLGLTTT
ncbi:uncharacterized protein KY384_003210 [Bacidia gigantensis]|uniref:uncharacterized protein n=1 Tax=Bacidia gigantensis TaxID=2732470 RepID=UPI001D04BA1A|nr:uncharacterized protein KY384_003210 [Bacidia gigantensis]KAG8531580.1 hypothetical protein KY384_003210 [Bacidia gigantensis]